MSTESPNLGVADATPVNGRLRLDKVRSFGSAGRGGLQNGDELVSLNGTPIASLDQANTLVGSLNVGDAVAAVYVRNGAQATASIKLRAGKKALNVDIEEVEEVLERKISP